MHGYEKRKKKKKSRHFKKSNNEFIFGDNFYSDHLICLKFIFSSFQMKT